MATSAKAIAMMRTLKENIKRRLPTYTFTDGLDSDLNPLLLVSADATPATTEQVCLLRIRPVGLSFTNAIGGTQENMTPHFVESVLEADVTLTSTARLTEANQVAIKGEIMKLSGLYISYMTASGTVPAIANVATQMVAANIVGQFEIDPSYRLMGA